MSGSLRPAGPFPPAGLDEKATLCAFLDWYRDAVVRKTEDLERDAAVKRLGPSMTSLLGIVKHLGYVERGWFQRRFMGRDAFRPPPNERDDQEFRIDDDETVASVIAWYRTEIDTSDAIIAAHDLDALSQQPDERGQNLRWIMVHMIEETARHAGQADILRELTDGATGE